MNYSYKKEVPHGNQARQTIHPRRPKHSGLNPVRARHNLWPDCPHDLPPAQRPPRW